MNKLNKICIMFLLIVLIILLNITIVNASDYGATVDMSSSTTNSLKINDTFTITLSLKSVTNVDGVATVHAKLNYDKNVLEYVSCEATNSWSTPIYNSENQEFVTERSDVMMARWRYNEN